MNLLSFRRLSTSIFLTVGLLFGCQTVNAEQVPAGEAGGVGSEKSQMQEITDAWARFKDRDVEGAVKLLEAATKKNPDLPPPYVLLAQFYIQANIAQGVQAALETGVQKNPEDPEAYVLLAQLSLRDRRITEAELLFTKANTILAKYDKNAKRKADLTSVVTAGLAQVYQSREDWTTAKKYLDSWLKADPKNAQALGQLASVLFKQKDADGALAKLKEAKAADPKAMTPEAILAVYYQQSGDKDNAKKLMEKALAAAPNDLNTQIVAAQLSLENAQLEDAQNRAAAALRIDSTSMDAKNLRGLVALFQKDYKTAERYFEDAHLKSPGNFSASNNLALALVEQKDESKKRRALEFAANNMQQYKNTTNAVEAASTYGWVQFKLGQLDEADKALSAAISGNFAPDTAYYAAVVANEKNRKEEAKTLLKAALKNPAPFTMKQEATALLEQLNRQ
jgi:tetratricopeptide (TPR) repeat protein